MPVEAIRNAIPTVRHASMLFEMVADLLVERSHIETAGGGRRRTLFRREDPGADWIVPWPLLSLGLGGRLSTVVTLSAPPGAPDEPPPRPGRPPRLRGLRPGEVVIHDGADSITVTYGEDGRWIETSRGGGPATLAGAVPAVAKETGPPVELLAESLDLHDLDQQLDAVSLPEPPQVPAHLLANRPPAKCLLVTYDCVDADTRMLDGDHLRWRVARCRSY